MFLYLGRRGLGRLVREIVEAAAADPAVAPALILSRHNEALPELVGTGVEVLVVDTFAADRGVATKAWRIPLLRRRLVQGIRQTGATTVVDLMPHAWSSYLIPAIRGAGASYTCVVHDARPHPGDRTALVMPLVRRAARLADRVIALSGPVAVDLRAHVAIREARVSVLFHPDLHFPGSKSIDADAAPHSPLRLLFLGRILPYKGLGLFLDTVEALRAAGVDVAPGVFGEGDLGTHGPRLGAAGAEITNRWLSEAEIGAVLARYDVLLASHVEASQSGAVAAALGAGIPAVVTPVGGLVEQVQEGVTGAVAASASAHALAAAVQRLVVSPGRYADVRRTIIERAPERSVERFLRACIVASGPV
jgi:glycosyltransferase involved in cell wall biosynthesis